MNEVKNEEKKINNWVKKKKYKVGLNNNEKMFLIYFDSQEIK